MRKIIGESVSLTVINGFKRLILVLVAAMTVGTLFLAATRYLISADTVRLQAAREIRAVTGLDPMLRGETKVSLFPTGSVSFDDVLLGDPQRPTLTAERLTARLRFFPLLIGRIEISDVSLERPRIAIDIGPNGQSNWAGLIEGLARNQQPGSRHKPMAFSEMRINGGTVLLRNRQRNLSETFDNVDISLAWPSIAKSFGATGHFVWRDEPVDASFTLSDFPMALAGGRTGLKLRLAGKPLKAAFEGAVSLKPTLKLEGTVAADSVSLRNALFWVGQKQLPGGGFGHFAIKAQTNIVGGTIGLSSVNIELDGNTAEGVLNFATDGRQTLQGTLATDALDLTPYVAAARLLAANQHAWNNTRIGLDGLSDLDFDLRLSAATMKMADAKFGRTAIGANLNAGHLAITIGEAQAYGGMVQGSLTLANFENGIDVKSQLKFGGVDLATCLAQLFGIHRLEGKGDIVLSVAGTGQSVLAVTRTLNGNVSLTGAKGALSGLDVEQLLRRLERRPLSGGGDFRTGRTPYDQISVALKIVDGTVSVEDVRIDGSAVKLALEGTASIPARELNLKGIAALVSVTRPDATPFELPFIVQGSWDDPIMLPDPEVLIRRSGAAAPLLRALHEHAPDQARSVIERLAGKSAGATPPPAQATAPIPAIK